MSTLLSGTANLAAQIVGQKKECYENMKFKAKSEILRIARTWIQGSESPGVPHDHLWQTIKDTYLTNSISWPLHFQDRRVAPKTMQDKNGG